MTTPACSTNAFSTSCAASVFVTGWEVCNLIGMKRTIYAVEIEGDLRSTFYLDGEAVVSLIIGTHDIYKG